MNRFLAAFVSAVVVASVPAAALAQTLPATLFAGTPPADAKPVSEAKPTATVGERILLRGRIGGSREPMVANRALFTIVDPALPICGEKHADGCKTPWDYCCEDKKEVAFKSATIQIVGTDGKVLKQGLLGVRGLLPTTEVWITGTVQATDRATVLLVDAESLWIAKLGTCAFSNGELPDAKPLAGAVELKPGATVTVRGTVAVDAAKPAAPGTFTLRDGDRTATILIADKSGVAVKSSLEGMNGLVQSRAVSVEGVVEKVDDGVATIRAARVAVAK